MPALALASAPGARVRLHLFWLGPGAGTLDPG